MSHNTEHVIAAMISGLRAVHGRLSKGARNRRNRAIRAGRRPPIPREAPDVSPDWSNGCDLCGASPVVPVTGMCGPCTFGEADTAGGEW